MQAYLVKTAATDSGFCNIQPNGPDSFDDLMICDVLGPNQHGPSGAVVIAAANRRKFIRVAPTQDVLAVRDGMIDGTATPSILADAIEDAREDWIEASEPETILAMLRKCW